MTEPQKTAIIALMGPPNAGKSTLLNSLLGEKVSIVSPKAQTTRTRIRGILSDEPHQLIFVDTPGLFTPKKKLERAIVQAAEEGMVDADLLVLVLDAATPYCRKDAAFVIDKLKHATQKIYLVLNKIDLIDKKDLLALTQDLSQMREFAAVYMISAHNGYGVPDMIRDFKKLAPEGPWLFSPDQLTDLPNRLMAAELTREHLFRRLHQELPYQLTVETESWENFDNGDAKISQVIFVARDGHKGIILGKQGQTLKAVSTAARLEMEALLGRRIHLKIFVKVKENWMDDPERLSIWGLEG